MRTLLAFTHVVLATPRQVFILYKFPNLSVKTSSLIENLLHKCKPREREDSHRSSSSTILQEDTKICDQLANCSDMMNKLLCIDLEQRNKNCTCSTATDRRLRDIQQICNRWLYFICIVEKLTELHDLRGMKQIIEIGLTPPVVGICLSLKKCSK